MGRGGLIPFSGSFNRRIAEPIDDYRVAAKADLLLAETWTAGDGVVYTWLGLFAVVYADTSNNGGYLLINSDYSQESSWLKIGSSVDLSDYVTNTTLFRNGRIKSELLPEITSDVIELLEITAYIEEVIDMIEGDRVYNSVDKKIYTYTAGDWSNPTSPEINKLYLCKADTLTYKWNGITLITTSSPLPYASASVTVAGTSTTMLVTPYSAYTAFKYWVQNTAFNTFSTVSKSIKGAINELNSNKENTGVASGLVTQLIDGATDDTLKKLQDKITALQAIVGGSAPDGDNIVNTVTELLAVFSAFPEGADIAAVLASKVNVTDVYNALDAVVSGKVLDARQGKVLNDSIAALSTSLANYQLIVDNTFNTTSKTVPGAVNEVYGLAKKEIFVIAIDSAVADATAGIKYSDIFPFAFTLELIQLNLQVAPTGSTFQVDIKKNGVSIFTTKLTVDATEKTNATAAIPYVMTASTINFTTSDEYSIIIDQVGAVVTGKNPVIKLIGKRTI